MQIGNYDNEQGAYDDASRVRDLYAARESPTSGALGATGEIDKVSQAESRLAYEIGDFRKGFVIRSF